MVIEFWKLYGRMHEILLVENIHVIGINLGSKG